MSLKPKTEKAVADLRLARFTPTSVKAVARVLKRTVTGTVKVKNPERYAHASARTVRPDPAGGE